MAFRIGGLPIFSPIKIPSRLPHDGLLARHSRFKLLPNSWIPTQACRTRSNANRAKHPPFVSPLLQIIVVPRLAPTLSLSRERGKPRSSRFRGSIFLRTHEMLKWNAFYIPCLHFSWVFIFLLYLTDKNALICQGYKYKKVDRLRYNNFNYRCLKN